MSSLNFNLPWWKFNLSELYIDNKKKSNLSIQASRIKINLPGATMYLLRTSVEIFTDPI